MNVILQNAAAAMYGGVGGAVAVEWLTAELSTVSPTFDSLPQRRKVLGYFLIALITVCMWLLWPVMVPLDYAARRWWFPRFFRNKEERNDDD
jgi:hypothetical protein